MATARPTRVQGNTNEPKIDVLQRIESHRAKTIRSIIPKPARIVPRCSKPVPAVEGDIPPVCRLQIHRRHSIRFGPSSAGCMRLQAHILRDRSTARRFPLLSFLLAQKPLHALVHRALAGAKPLFFRHMRLLIPISHAIGMPFGGLRPYLLLRQGYGQDRSIRFRAQLGKSWHRGNDQRERAEPSQQREDKSEWFRAENAGTVIPERIATNRGNCRRSSLALPRSYADVNIPRISTLPSHDDLLINLTQSTMDNDIRTAGYGSPRVAPHADRVSSSEPC